MQKREKIRIYTHSLTVAVAITNAIQNIASYIQQKYVDFTVYTRAHSNFCIGWRPFRYMAVHCTQYTQQSRQSVSQPTNQPSRQPAIHIQPSRYPGSQPQFCRHCRVILNRFKYRKHHLCFGKRVYIPFIYICMYT